MKRWSDCGARIFGALFAQSFGYEWFCGVDFSGEGCRREWVLALPCIAVSHVVCPAEGQVGGGYEKKKMWWKVKMCRG